MAKPALAVRGDSVPELLGAELLPDGTKQQFVTAATAPLVPVWGNAASRRYTLVGTNGQSQVLVPPSGAQIARIRVDGDINFTDDDPSGGSHQAPTIEGATFAANVGWPLYGGSPGEEFDVVIVDGNGVYHPEWFKMIPRAAAATVHVYAAWYRKP